MAGNAGRLDVDADRVLEIPAVAAGDRDRDREADLATELDDEGVPPGETIEGETKPAERVPFVRIGTGEIDDEVGLSACQHRRQVVGKECKKMLIARAVRKLDVEGAGDLVEWVIPAAMHAESEDAIVAGEDGVGPVPLMDVEVDYGSAPYTVSALQASNGDRDVVEDAEPFAVVGKCVMRSSREIHRYAVFERGGRRFAGAADGAKGALDKRGRPGKTEAAELGRIQRAGDEPVDVIGGMHEEKRVPRRALGLADRVGPNDPLD